MAPAVPETLEAAVQDLFSRADVVFVGEVLSIERTGSAVLVHWQVQDAVRGTSVGGVYTLREWPGLWEGSSARYLQGQRALLLLHTSSAGGYASPVGDGDGVIPLHGDIADGTLDMRLLAQRVVVTDAARVRPLALLKQAGGALELSDALQRQPVMQRAAAAQLVSHGMAGPQASVPDPAGEAGAPAPELPAPDLPASLAPNTLAGNTSSVEGAVLLGMLHAWQRTAGSGR